MLMEYVDVSPTQNDAGDDRNNPNFLFCAIKVARLTLDSSQNVSFVHISIMISQARAGEMMPLAYNEYKNRFSATD